MISFSWLGETFLLHHQRCMYWEKEKMLILSDMHVGKSGHFRKEGIAIPQQVYQNDLNRLFAMIALFNPQEVMLVGDLFHSRANKEWEWFADMRNQIPDIQFTLVLGNHDVLPRGVAENMHLQLCHRLDKGPFQFLHNANDVLQDDKSISGFISGHVHPSVMIPSGMRQKMRLPCFHFTGNTCTLPAFSIFTGNYTIKPKASDRVFVITANEVISV